MDGEYSKQIEKASEQPRARAIVEWIEGDLNRRPIVYPAGGSDELDEAMVNAIRERWGSRP